jgi:hypothetical protein
LRLHELWVKPGIFQLPRQDDQRAVVKLGHILIGVGRDDGDGSFWE